MIKSKDGDDNDDGINVISEIIIKIKYLVYFTRMVLIIIR